MPDDSSVGSDEDPALSDIPDFGCDINSSGLNESPVEIHTAGARLPLHGEKSKAAASATQINDVAGCSEVH